MVSISFKGVRLGLMVAGALVALAPPGPARAESEARRPYHLAVQPLADALRAISRESGREIIFPSDVVQDKKSSSVSGMLSADEAISAALVGTGLVADFQSGMVTIRGRSEPSGAHAPHSTEEAAIVVTGSRIHGADSSSPIHRMTRNDMRDAGRNTLADAIRTIPQNFGGGQNLAVDINAPGGGNATGASTINLRGLGGDATLTLLNGHRLPYNGQLQSVDVSAIPLEAIDRLEIVADGASAIYGSDAVAGVANVVLRPDYEGLSASLRLGASTDGGNVQQQYGAVAGTRWAAGGMLIAYDFERDTAVAGHQRSYIGERSQGSTLNPFLRRHSALLTGHQDLTPDLHATLDVLFNRRFTDQQVALNGQTDYRRDGVDRTTRNTSFVIAPAVSLDLSDSWQASLSGTYGRDRSHLRQSQFLDHAVAFETSYCTCNVAHGAEVSLTGPLLHLPAGPLRLAIGGGYRSNTFRLTDPGISETQATYFGFGELYIPVIAPEQSVPLVHRLSFNAAIRYEDYPGVDRVATPKFGMVLAPSPDFEIKGSWGRSFKAPTLYQRFFTPRAILFTAASRGGSGYPADATALLLFGGNPDLTAERATTWSATLAAHPRALPGATLEITYFHIRYRDRVVVPLTFANQALSNPIYRDLVDFDPSEEAKAAAVAIQPFFNVAGADYDPAKVVALIYDNNLNAARQVIEGVDASAHYAFAAGEAGTVTLTFDGSYLRSAQQLSALQPSTRLAGTVFNPPHLRGRAGAVWTDHDLTLAAFFNYTGGVDDVRAMTPYRLGAQSTVDLTARTVVHGGPPILDGLEVSLSAQNLFNSKPEPIVQFSDADPPFDSTNYSSVGRFISLTLSKHW